MAIVVFRLLDRQPTDSKEVGNESQPLDFAEFYDIKNPFFITLAGGGREYYRYVKGSKSLKLEQQILDKEIYNPLEDRLFFKSGEDILVDDEADKNMVDILKMHPWNIKSEYHKDGLNPNVFETWSAQEVAAKEIADINAIDDAMDIVRGLRTNQKKLMMMAYIFGVSTVLSPEEIYLQLRAKAEEQPKEFINSIGNLKSIVTANIRKAFDLTVITWDVKGCIFTKEGGVIMERSGMSVSKNEGMLVDLLMSEEGRTAYLQILALNDHAEIDLNNAKT